MELGIILFIILVLIIIKLKIMNVKLKKYKNCIFKDHDEVELKLLVGYSYVKSLPKLKSIIDELSLKNLQKNKITFIKDTIKIIDSSIYSKELLDKTTYYENEYLYKKNIINMSLIIKAINRILDDKYDIKFSRNELKRFNKSIKKIEKKSKFILFFRRNKLNYYNNVEKIKLSYSNLIDSTNPNILLLFVKDYIKKINGV